MASQQLSIRDNYNLQAQQSTQLMFGAVGKNAALLKKQLPNGRIVIEVAVKTEENGGKVHRVAAIHLENNTAVVKEGKLKVDISVYKYDEMLGAVPSLPAPPSSSSLSKTTQSPKYFDLLSTQVMKNLKFDSEQGCRCTTAFHIIELLKNHVFPSGIPLPSHAIPLENYLIVMVNPDTTGIKTLEWTTVRHFKPPEESELLDSDNECELGCYLPRNSDGFAWETGSGSADAIGQHQMHGSCSPLDPSTRFLKAANGGSLATNAFTQFDHLTKVAQGKALPTSIPLHAIGASSSASYLLEDQKDTLEQIKET